VFPSEIQMLLVIFGAGASYDSIPFIPPQNYNQFRPPLGDNLFEARQYFLDIMSRYPRCKGIAPHLIGGSVEQKLQELSAGANPEVRRQLTAVKYYLQEVITLCDKQWSRLSRGITNYRGLFDEIEGWRQRQNTNICVVTFNYDTLLESALVEDPRIQKKLERIEDYVLPPYTLVKAHGSINWGHDYSPQTDASTLISLRQGTPSDIVGQKNRMIDLSSAIKLDEKFYLIQGDLKTGYLTPALAIPVETKSDYECPKDHIDRLCQFLPSVKIMITIGWRAKERTLMDMLIDRLSSNVKTMVVSSSPESANKRIKFMEQAGLKCEFFPANVAGFTQFASGREATRFLNQMSAQLGLVS